MTSSVHLGAQAERLRSLGSPTEDQLLEVFLEHARGRGLELYPAQEEAILELLAGSNVILNTPTGSGKSLVALAACFKVLAEGGRAFYTAPIKALVSEKFFELCDALGPDQVGMMTGDATVNRDAPVICCTAEILSNLSLRDGEAAPLACAVMDEFHYYADRDRGVAWQVPLLQLPHVRFLLMSATLGEPDFFVKELTRLTGAATALVRSNERPVPLDYQYSEEPLQQAVLDLVEQGRVPVYIVHFSQRAACEQAQNLMSLNFTSKEQKVQLKEELRGVRLDSPFGRELSRFLPHGVGVHHAGMLPRYRRLVERLAQSGLLRVICGTDTLGVGVNVPIRTVLFTQLCKFDGQSVGLLSVRDFQQIAGRAGRRGYDTAGSVVVQAPEHEIENRLLKMRAEGNPKKQKKLRLKKPPEKGFAPWNAETLEKLRASQPETLQSSVRVDHGLILNALAGGGGCAGLRHLLRSCHEEPQQKKRLLRHGAELFAALVSAGIVDTSSGRARLSDDLQWDFSLTQALSLYAVEVIQSLDAEREDHALCVVSVVESILENPGAVLYRQVAELKSRRMAELKAAGVEYEERLEELEKVEYPKPEAELLRETFRLFSEQHPWVSGYRVAPKSVLRDMIESCASFHDYVKEYGLARAEGVLLRYLSDAYRVLRQTVPEAQKTDELLDIQDWLEAELRRVDASLVDEWEQLQSGAPRATSDSEQDLRGVDVTRDRKSFTALVRTACFRMVQALASRNYDLALERLQAMAPEQSLPKDAQGEPWTAERLQHAMEPYFQEYDSVAVDAAARGPKFFQFHWDQGGAHVRQVLCDPEEDHSWSLVFVVDVPASAEQSQVVASLQDIGENAEP